MVARQLISRILFTLCICALLTGALPSQIAYADNSSIPVNREILSAPEWEQVKALLPASVSQTSQQAYLKASNTEEGDFLGLVTAISGDTLAVGTYLEDSNSVGVNGDGSNNLAVDSGAVYVFTRSNGVWAQQAYIKASNTEAGDRFGFSVALSGDTLVVGARYEDGSSVGVNGDETDNLATNSGAVYVFKREGVTWSQEAYLKASNTGADDQFGSFVSISNDTIVVGSPLEDGSANIVNGDDDNLRMNSGAAYVFFRDVEWIQQAYLKASINITTDLFGISVSSYGDTVVVGANGGSGKAYIFVRNGSPWGGTWNLQTYLTASNPTPDMQFGTSVALWGDTLVVGADFESSNATGVNGNQADKSMNAAGAAYVFVRNGTTWSQQAYLKASNTDSWDYFGREVAIWGDTIVVGASGESSNATGINGDESNDLATNSGAAYVFSREGTFWSQIAYLKASNSEAYDNFATDVAIDANTIISGGVGEDSSAIGINGDQTNNSATSSGAVYAYTIPNHSSLTWNTFLGGSLGVTEGYDLYTDELGNVYVVGDTSPYYNIGGTYLDPTWGSPIRAYGGAGDGFIAKLDSSGHLLWNTFLGGNQSDGITGVIVDGNGNIYVAGGSSAEWGSPLRLHSGNGYDGFIAKLTSSGELVWNTFLSNSGFSGIDLDDAGNIYLSGSSITNWSIPDVPLSPHHGDYDAFVAKVSSAGDLIWYTFLGGDVRDIANSIVVSPDGNIYIAGTSDSTWGTPVRPFTGIFWNAFAAKLTSSGSLLWNAFLGSGRDTGNDIAIDAGGNVYITGDSSGTWGTPIRPFEMNVPFPINAFVAELDTAGGLTWNTFVGDGGLTEGFGIGVDGNGLVYIDGTTCNSWGSPFRDVSGCTDAFIAMFDSSGNLLTNGFLGGAQTDEGQALHVSSQGELFLSGFSRGGWGYHPIRPYSRGPQDAFVAKLLLFPKVISINRADTSPTSASTVDFIISFFKPVVGIDTAGPAFDDFELSTTGSISGASITKISGSGDTYTVTVNTGNGTGTIRLDVPTTATITDLIGNTLNGLPYSNGEVYDVFKAPITISGNVGLAGVTLSYTDGTAKTVTPTVDGSYTITVPSGWSGAVTPTHSCYTFNPAEITYANVGANEAGRNYTATILPSSGCANIHVDVGGTNQGVYGIAPQGSVRPVYPLDTGPAKVASTNGVNIVAALRDAWLVNGQINSFSQLMGLPQELLSDTYYFPAYNNKTLSEQIRFANVDVVATDVTVTIAGVDYGPYHLEPSQGLRVTYDLDTGPVKVQSTGGVKIIAAIRDAWLVDGKINSFVQVMGLPAEQLSDTYYFPAYNNKTLSGQLRFGNVDVLATDVTVTIAGVEYGPYHLEPSESLRVTYDLDTGPVQVKSTGGVKIIAALRDAWLVNGKIKSFAQMMGLPAGALSDTYLFPAYNNKTLSGQLRFGNVDVAATDVTVTIAGVDYGPYHLEPSGSLRVTYDLDTGPVQVKSTGGVQIIAALRDAWLKNGQIISFVQMMGLPAGQLSDTYWFPAYNNVTLSGQLRFGVP